MLMWKSPDLGEEEKHSFYFMHTTELNLKFKVAVCFLPLILKMRLHSCLA